jgi:hypothetical protein
MPESPLIPSQPWMEWIYRDLGIPISERWDSCPISEARKHVPQVQIHEDLAFLHDDIERSFEIQVFPHPVRYWRVHPALTQSILSYCDAIENAPEVHVINSSFFHLTESLNPKGKLYLHRYARHYTPGWEDGPRKHKWNIINDVELSRRARLLNILGARR